MFGIGAGEFIMIAIVLLLAVGPKAMPKFMAAVGKGLREFRRTTRELRQQTGIDELLRDDQFRDPLGLKKPASTASRQRTRLTRTDREREYPREGVDLRHAWLHQADDEDDEHDEHAHAHDSAVEGEAS